jgi:hypothetical protein
MENTGKFRFEDDVPQWYVVVGKQPTGPISTFELNEKIQSRVFSWVDYGWKKGLPTWKRLCDIEDLRALMPQGPAPEFQKQFKVEPAAQSSTKSPAHVISKGSSRRTAVKPSVKQVDPRSARPSEDQPESDQEPRIWYLYYNHSQYGPFHQREILRGISVGKINAHVHAWCKGMDNWEKLSQLPAFESLKSKRPDKSEKRQSLRRPMVAQVMMSDEETVIVGVCRDISVGGLQVLADKVPAPVGSNLKMNISPPNGRGPKEFAPFVAEGVIVRVLEDGRGFSFRFTKLSDAARKSIEQYIHEER